MTRTPEEPTRLSDDTIELPTESIDPRFSIRRRLIHGSATVVTEPADPTTARSGSTAAWRSRYEMLEELGRGGMGIVWRARQGRLGRDVAVKTIRPERSSPAVERMFASEARIAGFLDHPNIVPVHDLDDTVSGELFMAMKLVGGRSWYDVLADGRDGLDRHLDILAAVCHAVAFAHSHGIIHCDLKPSNVMIGEYGEVLVMDWGLAVAWRPCPSQPDGIPWAASTRGPAGTLRYMAPEMAAGDGAALGPWSDLYLLGAILYEMLAGHPPHGGSTPAEILAGIRDGRVPALPDDAPGELAAVCRKAMAQDPDDRYQDVPEFREALAAYRSHRDSRALSRRAADELVRAEREHEESTARQAAFDLSIAGFEQSLLLWPENEEALVGVRRARMANARSALEVGDLGLAASRLGDVDDDAADALRAEIARARARRERTDRTTRRLRRAVALTVAVIVVGLVVGTVVLDRERSRADASAEEARDNADRWKTALADVRRLADAEVLDDLAARRDELWPAGPGTADGIAAWLEEADALRERLPDHRRTLEELRRRAAPVTVEQVRRAHAEHLSRRARLREMVDAYEDAADEDARRSPHLLEEAERMEDEIESIDEGLKGRRPWLYDERTDQWNHDVLARVVAGIAALHRPGGPVEEMRARLVAARNLRRVTVTEHAAAWEAALQAIRTSERYGGLELEPQVGLVPLGADPASGLEEFLHHATHDGPVPGRDTDGRLPVDEGTGLVLVLVPGGDLRLGPRADDAQRDLEGPVHTVELAPFFISKYEMSQAQWARFAGDNPSFYHPDFRLQGGFRATPLHPVEQVSWTAARTVLRRLGLDLPTEARWEYAARAGTDTAWWSGATRESLVGVCNMADATAREAGAPWPTLADWPEYRDGFSAHAPVTALAANPFGLHNVHGNVWEWCLDGHGVYHYPTRAGDGERLPARAHTRVMRGGGFTDAAANTRSGHRSYEVPDYQANDLGVRPARPVRRAP